MIRYVVSLFILVPLVASAAGSGFVDSQVSFSSTVFMEGTTMTLSVEVRNETARNVEPMVKFFDGDIVLGSKTITILPGETEEVSILWTLTPGTHEVSASIISSDSAFTGLTETEPVKVSVVKKVDEELPETASSVLEGVDSLKETIVAYIPEDIRNWFLKLFSRIETFRLEMAMTFEAKKMQAEAEVQELLIEEVRESELDETYEGEEYINQENKEQFQAPWKEMQVLWFDLVAYLFKTAWIFYSVLILLLFLIIRSFVRAIHR